MTSKGSVWREVYVILGDLARRGDVAALRWFLGELRALADDGRAREAAEALLLAGWTGEGGNGA